MTLYVFEMYDVFRTTTSGAVEMANDQAAHHDAVRRALEITYKGCNLDWDTTVVVTVRDQTLTDLMIVRLVAQTEKL